MNLTEQLKRDGHLLRGAIRTKKKHGLRHASPKRQEQNKQYLKLRREFLRAHPVCMAWEIIHFSAHDNGWAETIKNLPQKHPLSSEIHHTRKPKATYLNDTSTWLAVSKWAHRWIESHKNVARQLGLLENV